MMLTKEQKREVERRIENWGLWGGGPGGPRGVTGTPFPAYNLVNVGSTRAEEHDNLVISGEAEDTDRILRKMHPDHKLALEVFYLSKKSLPRTLASLCRCSVAQFYRRVRRAEVVFNRLCYPRQHQESTKEIACAA